MGGPAETIPERIARIALAIARSEPVSIVDLRTLYLFGPGRVGAELTSGEKVEVLVRTSLDAALGDIRPSVHRDEDGRSRSSEDSRYWLAAAGYLMLLDQLATVIEGRFEDLLTSGIASLPSEEAAALYGLRNAFLHSYGLVNDPTETVVRGKARRALLRHVYRLEVGSDVLVRIGDRTDVLTKPLADLPHTHVDLERLGDLVEHVVAEVRRRHIAGEPLRWQIDDVGEFITRFFFTHLA